jgi:hypothetical protein
MLNLAQGSYQLAEPAVQRLLAQSPDNVLALMALARLQFIRRAPDQALATYRKLLTLAPDMKPDPRVGLGLCAWLLGDKALAVKAWDRALERVSVCICSTDDRTRIVFRLSFFSVSPTSIRPKMLMFPRRSALLRAPKPSRFSSEYSQRTTKWLLPLWPSSASHQLVVTSLKHPSLPSVPSSSRIHGGIRSWQTRKGGD